MVSYLKMNFFLLSKAAQGFLAEAYLSTSKSKSRGERSSAKKGPFSDGNQLGVKK